MVPSGKNSKWISIALHCLAPMRMTVEICMIYCDKSWRHPHEHLFYEDKPWVFLEEQPRNCASISHVSELRIQWLLKAHWTWVLLLSKVCLGFLNMFLLASNPLEILQIVSFIVNIYGFPWISMIMVARNTQRMLQQTHHHWWFGHSSYFFGDVFSRKLQLRHTSLFLVPSQRALPFSERMTILTAGNIC